MDSSESIVTLKQRAADFPALRSEENRALWLQNTLYKRWGLKKHGLARTIEEVLKVPYSKACDLVSGKTSDSVTNANFAIVFDFWLVNWLYDNISAYMEFWSAGDRGRTVKSLLMGDASADLSENNAQWATSIEKAVDFVNFQLTVENVIDPVANTIEITDEFVDYYRARILNTAKLIKLEQEGGSVFDVNTKQQRALLKEHQRVRGMGRTL
tara:strand:+ start:445 stop:1080 length:636 start_codon:yes stop_codon:yes gene_type:complete